jgi:hypothetical protein
MSPGKTADFAQATTLLRLARNENSDCNAYSLKTGEFQGLERHCEPQNDG